MIGGLVAGLAYFVIVFTCAFAFGTLRVLVLVPWLGELTAVAVEVPVVLAVSWATCNRLTAAFGMSRALGPRLAMGGVAWTLLMITEAALSVAMFGRSLAEFVTGLITTPGLIGVAAQLIFGAIPVLAARFGR